MFDFNYSSREERLQCKPNSTPANTKVTEVFKRENREGTKGAHEKV
jgi:hypothetical protein